MKKLGVVVVKWLVYSAYSPMILVRIPRFSVKQCGFEKNENKIEAGVGPFKKRSKISNLAVVVVSMLAYFSNDLSSNPSKVWSCYSVNLLENNKNKGKGYKDCPLKIDKVICIYALCRPRKAHSP